MHITHHVSKAAACTKKAARTREQKRVTSSEAEHGASQKQQRKPSVRVHGDGIEIVAHNIATQWQQHKQLAAILLYGNFVASPVQGQSVGRRKEGENQRYHAGQGHVERRQQHGREQHDHRKILKPRCRLRRDFCAVRWTTRLLARLPTAEQLHKLFLQPVSAKDNRAEKEKEREKKREMYELRPEAECTPLWIRH